MTPTGLVALMLDVLLPVISSHLHMESYIYPGDLEGTEAEYMGYILYDRREYYVISTLAIDHAKNPKHHDRMNHINI